MWGQWYRDQQHYFLKSVASIKLRCIMKCYCRYSTSYSTFKWRPNEPSWKLEKKLYISIILSLMLKRVTSSNIQNFSSPACRCPLQQQCTPKPLWRLCRCNWLTLHFQEAFTGTLHPFSLFWFWLWTEWNESTHGCLRSAETWQGMAGSEADFCLYESQCAAS